MWLKENKSWEKCTNYKLTARWVSTPTLFRQPLPRSTDAFWCPRSLSPALVLSPCHSRDSLCPLLNVAEWNHNCSLSHPTPVAQHRQDSSPLLYVLVGLLTCFVLSFPIVWANDRVFIPSAFDGRLDHVQFLAMVSSATITISVHIFSHTFSTSAGSIPRSRTSGSEGMHVFRIRGRVPVVF